MAQTRNKPTTKPYRAQFRVPETHKNLLIEYCRKNKLTLTKALTSYIDKISV